MDRNDPLLNDLLLAKVVVFWMDKGFAVSDDECDEKWVVMYSESGERLSINRSILNDMTMLSNLVGE